MGRGVLGGGPRGSGGGVQERLRSRPLTLSVNLRASLAFFRQLRSKTVQESHETAQERPKTAQDALKTAQEAPRTPQDRLTLVLLRCSLSYQNLLHVRRAACCP